MHAHTATIATIAMIVPIAPILPLVMIAIIVMIVAIAMSPTEAETVNAMQTDIAHPIEMTTDPMIADPMAVLA